MPRTLKVSAIDARMGRTIPSPAGSPGGSPRDRSPRDTSPRDTGDEKKSAEAASGASKKADTIKVAIRVRPFNAREKKKGCRSVVTMKKKTLVLRDEIKGKTKTFVFDFCYWSHSDSVTAVATQEDIFNDLGLYYVENAFQGYNSSVFAYGQTGSGKTYTMLGSGKEPGLIPRGCDELFRRVANDYAEGDLQVEVEASYLEVYMDRIFDLLAPPPKKGRSHKKGTDRKKLPIRFHTKHGSYVEGLSKHAVSSYSDVKKLMALGVANRTVAETAMNKMSSRSHCIFTLYMNVFSQSTGDIRSSKIHLIDLAGSERVTKTGVVGDRLEELKKINKSLSALGDCISALSTGAKFVPFNNSTLTTLLKESLGGNSKTIMMATISAADDNFDETLSTLRYAHRVKRIKVHAVKSKAESKASMERELRAEINRLKRRLDIQGSNPDAARGIGDQISAKEGELSRLKMDFEKKLTAMHSSYMQMAQRLMAMGVHIDADATTDSGTDLMDGRLRIDFKVAPKLVNLSADPSLSGTMVFFLTKEVMHIGTEESMEVPEILLSSEDLAVKPRHAKINVSSVRVDSSEKAREARKQAMRVVFDEVDIDDDEHLSYGEFNNFAEFMLQYPAAEDFRAFSKEDFEAFCVECGERPTVGLPFDVIFNQFHGGSTKAPANAVELRGFRKKLSKRLKASLRAFISEKFEVTEIVDHPSDKNKAYVIFEAEIPKAQFATLRSAIKDGSDGKWKVKVRRPDPGEIESALGSSDFVEELVVSLGLADATDKSAMLFVNGIRVTSELKKLVHGDHILIGSRHLFKFLVPKPKHAPGSKPKKKSPGIGGESVAEEDEDSEDMVSLRHLIKEELAKAEVPTTVKEFQSQMQRRMSCAAIKERNVDVLGLKYQLLSSRAIVAHGGDSSSLLKIHDTFMQDYRLLTAKCAAANSMALELDKNVLFCTQSTTFFDVAKNDLAERLLVMRECHYTEPELQLQMTPGQFERLFKKLSRFAALSKQDGEVIAAETMDDDPFVPGEIDTCYALTTLNMKSLRKDFVKLPLYRSGSEAVIGTLEVKSGFLVADRLQTNWERVEGSVATFNLELGKATFDVSVTKGAVMFCAFGDALHKYEVFADGGDSDDESETFAVASASSSSLEPESNELIFNDVYRVAEVFVTPSVRHFLVNGGIKMQLWLPVFSDVSMMPPIIAYKISSLPITISVQPPGGEMVKISLKSGNRVAALKRKIDFMTGIADDNQTLIYGSTTLEDYKTLLDYDMKDGDEVTVMFGSGRRASIDGKLHGGALMVAAATVATVPEHSADIAEDGDADSDVEELPAELVRAMRKELTNPDLTPEERARIKRVKNQSVHLQMMASDSDRQSAMTLEGYKEENIQLKHALGMARRKIDQLQRRVADLETKIASSGAKKKGGSRTSAKFFGSWGKRKSKRSVGGK